MSFFFLVHDFSSMILAPWRVAILLSRIVFESGKKKAEFVVQLPPNGVAIQSGTPSHLNFDFAVAAYANGSKVDKPAATLARTIAPALSESQLSVVRNSGMGFKNTLELDPGKYIVRIVIRDNLTGKVGSVTSPLMVN